MNHPARYSLFALLCLGLAGPNADARPLDFKEVSLLVRVHESEASIRDEVAQRKLLHSLSAQQETVLKAQGASDSLLKALRDSNLVISKEEAALLETAPKVQSQL